MTRVAVLFVSELIKGLRDFFFLLRLKVVRSVECFCDLSLFVLGKFLRVRFRGLDLLVPFKFKQLIFQGIILELQTTICIKRLLQFDTQTCKLIVDGLAVFVVVPLLLFCFLLMIRFFVGFLTATAVNSFIFFGR